MPCISVLWTLIQGITTFMGRSNTSTLTRAGKHLRDHLADRGEPVITPFEFFHIVWRMHQANDSKLYLRHDTPDKKDCERLRSMLKEARVTAPDPDYGGRVIRILSVPDQPAEVIVCLVDPTVYISHLSAMQRWGLTNRVPNALMLTRPDRATANIQRRERMSEILDTDEDNPFTLNVDAHPAQVRRRPVQVHGSKTAGAWVRSRRDNTRLSTIGQTFLDMLQKPDLCGGMNHVLDVWEEHAETHLNEIAQAVDAASSGLVKSRAGYIIEERLGLSHPKVEPWKALGQRGGTRKLDPAKGFAPEYSDTWMISLNA